MDNYTMRKILIAPLIALLQLGAYGQSSQDSLLNEVTLQQAVDYSIKYQPVIRQSLLDEQITEANIRSRLADWYPQVNFNYNLQHNFVVQTSIIGGNPVKLGVDNTSSMQFTASQTLFNRDVVLASRTKRDVRQQARQTTSSNKIEIAAAVSKAFYDVLASTQQVKVSDENIVRVERSLRDAYNQYKAGITDKTDYKRATIALNNARAAKKSNEELLKAKLEYLKSLMGYPEKEPLNIVYDSLQMEKEAFIDTLQQINYSNRIEYKLLETQQSLLQANLRYEKWSFLPSLSANGAYNLNYLNNEFSKLYNVNYPNSFAALTLAFPIFQGGRRKADIQAAQWQVQRNNLEMVNFRNAANAEYSAAVANYKGNLYNYLALKENLALAREVYDIIQLQYRNGIKTYLEVINSETDLRTAQINYYNALYNLMASKIDVQLALGQINY
jgi:outer membrane protein TolC